LERQRQAVPAVPVALTMGLYLLAELVVPVAMERRDRQVLLVLATMLAVAAALAVSPVIPSRAT